MSKALLLHCVDEAEYCVRRRLHEGRLLFSTDPGVDVHLKQVHGLDCAGMSSFLSHAELAGFRTKASETADRVLAAWDERVAPELNRRLDLRMRYFTPLYAFDGKLYLLGQMAFVEALRRITQAHGLSHILVCRSPYQTYLNAGPDMKDLIASFFPSLETEAVDYSAAPVEALGPVTRLRRFLATFRGRALVDKAATELAYFLRSWRVTGGRGTILLAEPLYFLGFLRDALSRHDVIRLRTDGYPMGLRWKGAREPKPDASAGLAGLDALFPAPAGEPFEAMFARAVREDFTRGAADYLGPVLALRKVRRTIPISLGVWGNIGGLAKCMVFEYLRSEGVPVVGTQHGNCYVDQIIPWTFESDFDRCDHFISWGFDDADLARAFPCAKAGMTVHPLGVVVPPAKSGAKRVVDVAFAPSLNMTLFNGGAMMIKPDMLLDRQIRILEHLNSLTGRSVYVKPFPFRRSAISPLLRRLSGVTVVDGMFLDEFLDTHAPRAVVIDYPASVLFQSLPLDAEIFLMPDELNPYEARALEELKRRVHYCEDVDTLLAKLDLFFSGRLEKKRDQTYYNHYVHKPDAREKTVRLIESLAR